jgi:exodeoxyribonuclease VII large subunit
MVPRNNIYNYNKVKAGEEETSSENALSLYQLNALVRQGLKACLPDAYWVQAELSEVHANYNGHCYVEFVQKDPRSNNLVAKARGTIWSNTYHILRPYFEQATGQTFTAGIKVLVKVTVEFHELYGFSLSVQDIDPTYTLGDMARRRQEILRQLQEEGVLTMNKELPLPACLQRIAVISSATAAGYGDFCNQLHRNPYGLVFYTRLFPAVMQGDRTEESVIAALDTIHSQVERWDAVVIIRGGGATSDLSCFDTYALAANCAQYPLPIITGIGHERDDTVIDSVSHTRVKTPTAAAEFLIAHQQETAEYVESLAAQLHESLTERLDAQHRRLQRLVERLPLQVEMCLQAERHQHERYAVRLESAVKALMLKQQHRIELIGQQLKAASPEHQLKRGYSITLKDGHAVTDASQLHPGDVITTRMYKGDIHSIVK